MSNSVLMPSGSVALLAFYFTISSHFNDKDEHISGRWVSMNGCFGVFMHTVMAECILKGCFSSVSHATAF